MSALVLAIVIAFIAGALVGFALGMEFGAQRVLDRWRAVLDQPIGETTPEREDRLR